MVISSRNRVKSLPAWIVVFIAPALLAADRPYIDPAQLDVPWPKHSFYKQPWRAYLETKPAVDFLSGVGIAYHANNDELAMRLLAETGFRAIRIEIGWGSIRWDEQGTNNDQRYRRLLELCRQYNMRPTMLLNAHQGVPCPTRFFRKQLVKDAPKGSTTIQLADTKDLVLHRSGLSGLTDYWAAEALVTAIDQATGICTLSKPLPKDFKAGPVNMATLKHAPVSLVGTKEFDDTAAGWMRYALLICNLVKSAGIDDFDIEIWNELTFGTKFLNINNYYEPDTAGKGPDFLREGGNCWELARRTVDSVKARHPRVRCIWGFSNTTFFHCPVDKLPPRMDGQSYHPYGTGTRSFPRDEAHQDRPDFNLERYTPTMDVRMPEGYGHVFYKTESLMRLLNPEARKRAPQGTQRFYHYVTEHGVVPAECGITDERGQWDIKTRCALRSFCLYLNKGLDVMHYFVAHQDSPGGMGLLPPELGRLDRNARFEDVATPPMKAIRNLTRAFAGARAIDKPISLRVDVKPAVPVGRVFPGDAAHPPLTHTDVFAFLPFQVTDRKLVIATYVMTYDVTRPMREERYRVTVGNLPSELDKVCLYDPITDRPIEASLIRQDNGLVEVELPTVDTPRLLTIELR